MMLKTYRDCERALVDAGFRHVRTKGSHRIYSKGSLTVPVPMNHPNRAASRVVLVNVKRAVRGSAII